VSLTSQVQTAGGSLAGKEHSLIWSTVVDRPFDAFCSGRGREGTDSLAISSGPVRSAAMGERKIGLPDRPIRQVDWGKQRWLEAEQAHVSEDGAETISVQ
jgi:hypothetical protein